MNKKTEKINNIEIMIIESKEIIIKDIQTALDFIMSATYDTDCRNVILNKEAISEEFFDLKTKIAGEVLQKFVTYSVRLAIVGDFSIYNSKSLKDFIYESNNGNNIFFVNNKEEAIKKITS